MIWKWSNLWRASLFLLLASSLWLRTCRLDSMPDVNGDECWHAVQMTRMLRGETYSLMTETGLPLSPFHAVMELPLLMMFGPTPAILRIPTVFTGILTIFLTFYLGSKVLDRSTALIAAGLMAVLPVSTYCARTGYESSHAPLFTLILVYFALRSNVLATSLLLSCSYFVHPTNIFLLPLLLAVTTVKTIEQRSPGEPWPWRRLAFKTIPPTVIVAAIGLWTIHRPMIHRLSTYFQSGINGRRDPLEFLTYFGRLMLGLGDGSWFRVDALFWSIFTIVLVLGTVRLIRGRQWDRLALVGGTLAGMAALFLMGSSNIIQPGMARYGYFLIVPTVLGFACLLRSLRVNSTGRWAGLARSVQIATLFGVGWALLLSNRLDLVNQFRTIGENRRDAREQAFEFVQGEMKRSGSKRGLIICTELMSRNYFKLLALSDPNMTIVDTGELGGYESYLAMLKGAYTINCPGAKPIRVDQMFRSGSFQRWEMPSRDGDGFTTVTCLSSEIPVLGDFDDDGRVDPAIFRRSDARWIASLSGGGTRDVVFGKGDMLEIPVTGDFDGDHKTDLAVFRPATDQWLIRSSHGVSWTIEFGCPETIKIPVPGDYDGDRTTDLALYFPSTSTFAIQSSKGEPIRIKQFGQFDFSDVAVGDYDGDGKTDIGVYTSHNAKFFFASSQEHQKGHAFSFGTVDRSVPAPGDYDGDGKTDLAVYNPGTSVISYRPSRGGEDRHLPFGLGNASVISPGDYDGDGKTDLAVYRPASALFTYRPSGGGNDVRLSSTRAGLVPTSGDVPKDVAASRSIKRK